jgi:hypothetical protein
VYKLTTVEPGVKWMSEEGPGDKVSKIIKMIDVDVMLLMMMMMFIFLDDRYFMFFILDASDGSFILILLTTCSWFSWSLSIYCLLQLTGERDGR